LKKLWRYVISFVGALPFSKYHVNLCNKIKNKTMTIVSSTELDIQKSTILSDKLLNDIMVRRNKKSLKDLKGKISFKDDYDYKLMRS
jgi:hypothetical protein